MRICLEARLVLAMGTLQLVQVLEMVLELLLVRERGAGIVTVLEQYYARM